MRSGLVKTAMVVEDRLYLVEDIEAQVCDSCVEQFYDDETTDALRRLAEDGFPSAEIKREILVPVFSLGARLRRNSGTLDDQQPAYTGAEA